MAKGRKFNPFRRAGGSEEGRTERQTGTRSLLQFGSNEDRIGLLNSTRHEDGTRSVSLFRQEDELGTTEFLAARARASDSELNIGLTAARSGAYSILDLQGFAGKKAHESGSTYDGMYSVLRPLAIDDDVGAADIGRIGFGLGTMEDPLGHRTHRVEADVTAARMRNHDGTSLDLLPLEMGGGVDWLEAGRRGPSMMMTVDARAGIADGRLTSSTGLSHELNLPSMETDARFGPERAFGGSLGANLFRWSASASETDGLGNDGTAKAEVDASLKAAFDISLNDVQPDGSIRRGASVEFSDGEFGYHQTTDGTGAKIMDGGSAAYARTAEWSNVDFDMDGRRETGRSYGVGPFELLSEGESPDVERAARDRVAGGLLSDLDLLGHAFGRYRQRGPGRRSR